MIILTEAAKWSSLTLGPEGEALRLDRATPNNDGESTLAIYLADPEEGDDPREHEGRPLLCGSLMVSAAYDGCVVDLAETPQSVGFAIGPPEETHALNGHALEDET